jgi:hypothetical protein
MEECAAVMEAQKLKLEGNKALKNGKLGEATGLYTRGLASLDACALGGEPVAAGAAVRAVLLTSRAVALAGNEGYELDEKQSDAVLADCRAAIAGQPR